jgi:hypothetical protein
MSIAYAQELTELIQLKTEQMKTKSGILAGIACVSLGENKARDQEDYDSFAKKKWLINLEIEALKAKRRNVLRLVPTPEGVQDEDEVWMLRVRFNSMIHAHEIMRMTADEMERIHATAAALKGSSLKSYWQHHIAICEKAVVDYRKAETEARSQLIKDVLARKTKDPSTYTVTY